jgi:hypothetical protein
MFVAKPFPGMFVAKPFPGMFVAKPFEEVSVAIIILIMCILIFVPYLSSFRGLTFNEFGGLLQEGMENAEDNTGETEYKPYSGTDPMILGQQNAGNIAFLKQRVDELQGISSKVDKLQSQIDLIQTQMGDLVQQQADFATSIAGNTPPDISGL